MDFDVLNDLQALDRLKDEWDQLDARSSSRHVFSDHRWVSACARHFGSDGLRIVTVRSPNRELVAALPLRIRTLNMRGVAWRALVHACERSSDYSALLIDESVNNRLAIRKIIEAIESIADQWDYVLLANLTDDSLHSNLLRAMLAERLYGGSMVCSMAPYIRYQGRYEEASKVGNIRRRFRKAEAAHRVALHIGSTPTPALLESLRALHQLTFPDQGFNTLANQAMYRELMNCPEFSPCLEFSWIEIDGALAAGHFGFKANRKLYYYVPSYDHRHASYGVGQYLLMAMIFHYRDAGFEEFDFLRGMEDYKFFWANGIRTNHAVFGALKSKLTLPKKTFANLWMTTRSLPAFAS